VWIEFEGGEPSYPIWSGCYWRDGELPGDAAPGKKLIVTAKGHKILLDDDEGSVTIEDSNGNGVFMNDAGIKLSRGSQALELTTSKLSVNDGALEVV
jgi:hypothetical protein